jgi:adenine-specific DNA-methyltransferase
MLKPERGDDADEDVGVPSRKFSPCLCVSVRGSPLATLNSDTSCPFDKPKNGRIAIKVTNHLGDEVMKVFRV